MVLFQDEQTVNDMSYSDHRDSNFDCGRQTLLSDVTTPSPPLDIGIDTKVAQLVDPRKVVKTKREADEEVADEDLVFSFTTQDKDSFFCGTTIINDRFEDSKDVKILLILFLYKGGW